MFVEDFLNKKIAVAFKPYDIDKLTEFQELLGELKFHSGIRADDDIIVNAIKRSNNTIIYVSLGVINRCDVMYLTDNKSYVTGRGYQIIPVDNFLGWHDLADISEDEITSLFN